MGKSKGKDMRKGKEELIKNAIKTHLIEKKWDGERATILVTVIAKKTNTGGRTIWKYIKKLCSEGEIARRQGEDGVWYFLPRYATRRTMGKILATQEHSKEIKEKVIKPLLYEIGKIKICWHGTYLCYVDKYFHENIKDETKEEFKTKYLESLVGNEDLVSKFLKSAKDMYGNILINKLWDDFIKNHINEKFGNPLEIIKGFENLLHEMWKIKEELFLHIQKTSKEIGLENYLNEILQKRKNIIEYLWKRINLMCLAVAYKDIAQKAILGYLDEGYEQIYKKTEKGVIYMDTIKDPLDEFIWDKRERITINNVFFLYEDVLSEIDKGKKEKLINFLEKLITKIKNNKKQLRKIDNLIRITHKIIELRERLEECLTDYLIAEISGVCEYMD